MDHRVELDHRSQDVTARLVDTLNKLPGTKLPAELGGGEVAKPLGVIHAGDIIDTGDKQGTSYREMQKTEWARFEEEYGLTGRDGRLKWPVYEVHGNHDGPQGKGVAVDGIRDRNRRRPGVKHISPNGLHYSFDWGPLRLVNLGIVVGSAPNVPRTRRYEPHGSLDFLNADLEKHVGTSGRPVVITHHIDLARNLQPPPEKHPGPFGEWDPSDVQAYFEALRPYRVAGIFYGHTHVRNMFRWRGAETAAYESDTGLPVFNVDNASHFSNQDQSLYYVAVEGDKLVVREYGTRDRWSTAAWTPTAWQVALT